MFKVIKVITIILFVLSCFSVNEGFAQAKKKKKLSLRDSLRHAILSRDSLMRTFKKSDTSINSQFKKLEDYTSSYNEIKANLSKGFDTVELSQELPRFERRIGTIKSLIDNDRSGTLRYLYAIRDFLTHLDAQLDIWQDQLKSNNDKLLQNQNDLQEFYKDSSLRVVPADSGLRHTFLAQKAALAIKWNKLDSINKKDFLKIGRLQNRVTTVYIAILDETDEINLKIRNFSIRSLTGEYNYIWDMKASQATDFNTALSKTVTMNKKLFNFFAGRDTLIHLSGLLLFVLFFSWIYTTKRKILRVRSVPNNILDQTHYISKYPLISAIVVTFAIVPNFYDHPPVVFLESFFIVLILAVLYLVRSNCPKPLFNYLHILFWITFVYSLSNLFVQVCNEDRVIVLLLAALSVIVSIRFLNIVKKAPETFLPYSTIILRIFIFLQAASFICNVFGRFSLAKIIGVTAIYNLWLALGLYFLVQIIMESLFLQLEVSKSKTSITSYIDYKLLQSKFRSILNICAIVLWLIMLSQNLSIEDAADAYIDNFLSNPHKLAGAAFTFQSIIIFIAVIWLSSVLAKIISYLYDIAGQHANDMSVLQKKNRTSTLLIRIAVFAIGFFLAVAASGFPLDKVTIIISAFGIGIGFGLQNIVNNLVSGLILAFEKPVQIGDIIEVDNRSGTIMEIGIRSSKLATSDGAEVIIPNGDLISHHVVNWTLSNTNRRVELIISVTGGSDIEKVKNILKNVLENRDDIMANKQPLIFVHNIKDGAIDFRILFWADEITTWLELKSRVLSDIYTAFNKEGIQLSSQQKEITVLFPEKDRSATNANKNEPDPDR